MLVVHPISGGQSRYYLEGPAAGRWVGTGCEELGLRGSVDEASLHAVLAGRQPGGEQLLDRVPATRRAGFDLILASPKSVSLLAALGDEDNQARFGQAQAQAVRSVLGYLEREAVWTRRGQDQRRIATTGLVGASFSHSRSAAHDPHLHTHVVVANLVHGDDGRWSCLDSRSLYGHAGAAGALFQATLRQHLSEQGLAFEWAVTRHGLGDIVGVPRAAIEAVSRRRRQVMKEIESGWAGQLGRASAGGRTRRAAEASRSPDEDGQWRARAAAGGLDQAAADRVLAVAALRPKLARSVAAPMPDTGALSRLLSEQHSRFRRPDVIRAAATLSIGGATESALETVADQFLATAIPAGGDRWTTAGLQRLEERIVAAATTPSQPTFGLVSARRDGPPRQPPELSGTSPPSAPGPQGVSDGLSDPARQAVARLTRGGAPVDLLRGELVSQAEVVDTARAAWEASGHRVALMSRNERGQARWQTLAGLERPPPAPAHATVVLVDNAERWSTPDLHEVIADAAARHAKVVLLDGGTQPRLRQAESPAVEKLRASLPAIDAGPAPPRLRDMVPPQVVAGRDGTVTLTPTGPGAMEQLVRDWQQREAAGERPRMVALGPEEAEHLNALARAARQDAGELKGPSVEIAGRHFQAGDQVTALRRDARLGSVPGGAIGRVTAVDPGQQQVSIEWAGREEAVTVAASAPGGRSSGARAGPKAAVPLAHGYATTPAYLRAGHDGPILSLGHVEAVAHGLRPDRIYEVAAIAVPDRARAPANPVSDLLAEIRGDADVTRPFRSDAGRPLTELAAERDRLAEYLCTGVPSDRRPELRRLAEEREWLVASLNQPGHQAPPAHPGWSALASLDQRWAVLNTASTERRQWLEQHRDQLERCVDLSTAIAWRETALGRAAEIRPTVAVEAQLGPPPADGTRRLAWRRAAEAVESYRDRWGLPDRALELNQSPSPTPATDLSRRAGELRILAASQELERSRGRDRALAPSGF